MINILHWLLFFLFFDSKRLLNQVISAGSYLHRVRVLRCKISWGHLRTVCLLHCFERIIFIACRGTCAIQNSLQLSLHLLLLRLLLHPHRSAMVVIKASACHGGFSFSPCRLGLLLNQFLDLVHLCTSLNRYELPSGW